MKNLDFQSLVLLLFSLHPGLNAFYFTPIDTFFMLGFARVNLHPWPVTFRLLRTTVATDTLVQTAIQSHLHT